MDVIKSIKSLLKKDEEVEEDIVVEEVPKIESPSHYELAQSANDSYRTKSFSSNDVEVLIQYKDGCQIFSVRGTEAGKMISGLGFMDVIRDMRFIPWWNEVIGFSHSGFLKGALKVIDEIENYAKKDMPIIFTGHSMGAAIALLLSILMKHRGYNVVEYVGFACPRVIVFNRQAHVDDDSMKFPMTIYRYQNDLVPMVPIAFPFYYHHIVELTQMGENGGLPSVFDHSMDNYENFLKPVKPYV